MITLHFTTDSFSLDEVPEQWKSRIIVSSKSVAIEIAEDDSSYRYQSLMARPKLTLKFSLPFFIEFPIGTYCEYMAQTYILNRAEDLKKQGTRNITYTMELGTLEDNLGIYKMRNTVDGRLKYSMCATPKEFIEEIVKNLNKRDGAGVWKVGTCIDASAKTVEFNHAYCDAALEDVASTFETEYEISNDFAISLHKVEYYKDDPLLLSYGKGNGFVPGVGRTTTSDDVPVKRLFVQGGDTNIDRSTYGTDFGYTNSPAELRLPKSQILAYEDRMYQSDEDGYYIERIDKISDATKEDSLDCSEIYPSRIGTVSAVDVPNADKNFYDIIDESIPENLNFEDYLIEGETMTIIFQSGMLAGDDKEFEVKYIHEKKTVNGVEKLARRFEITPQEIDGVTMPNETYKPQVGDTYAVFGCMLPKAYVCDDETQTGASWDMFREAARKMYDIEETKFTFSGELQALYAKRNWNKIGGRMKIGSYVLFTDNQFAKEGEKIRIVGIKDYLTAPYAPTLELSNSVSGESVTSSLRQIDNTEVVIDDTKDELLRFTKRRFRDAKETIEMLDEALDSFATNFTNSIQPVAVQTMSLLVGDEALQFRFVNSVTSPKQVEPSIVYDETNKQLKVGAGIIQHMTLGVSTISSKHNASEYLFWSLKKYESPVLDVASKRYYLYARVVSNGATGVANAGEFFLSEEAIALNKESGYYHLLVGVLNSEYDSTRSYVSLFGYTEVLPGRITTDKIVSSDGNTYFDLLNGVIAGKIKFLTGSDGLSSLDGYSDLTDSIQAAQDAADSAQNAADAADKAVGDLEDTVWGAFKDGIIDEAEAKAIATYINTVNSTKSAVQASYTQLYSNSYLTGLPKTSLQLAYNKLMTSIDNLITSINNAIADSKTTDEEAKDVNDKFDAYNTAYASYQSAVEVATNSIIAAIDAKADAAQSTADQAVKDAAAAQTTANTALSDAATANSSISDLNTYVDGAFKDGIIDEAEAKAIATYINTVNSTKSAVQASYSKLSNNDYISDTSKDELKSAYETLMTAIDNLTTAINAAIKDGVATSDEAAYVDKMFTTFNSAFASYNAAVESAYKNISGNILISADGSAKEEVAKLGETIIEGGYIKTELIKATELVVRHVLVETDSETDKRSVEISPENMDIEIRDADGEVCSTFEGNSYDAISKLFGDKSGTNLIKSRAYTSSGSSVTTYGYASGITLGRGKCTTVRGKTTTTSDDDDDDASLNEYSDEFVLSDSTSTGEVWKTDTPTEVTLKGHVYVYAYSYKSDSDVVETESTRIGASAIKPQVVGYSQARLYVYLRTYSDAECTKRIDSRIVASVYAYASAQSLATSSSVNYVKDGGWKSLEGKKAKTVAGYHRLEISIYQSANKTSANYSDVYWGAIDSSHSDLSATYQSEFYVSRFFANGFCLGMRQDNYVAAFKDKNDNMYFAYQNGGYGIECSSDGIKTKHHGGNWLTMPQLVFRGRAYYYKDSSGNEKYLWNNSYSFDGSTPTLTRLNEGQIKITFPESWTTKLGTLSFYNTIVNVVGYGQINSTKTNDNPNKANLYEFASTYLTITISDDESENDGSFYINIWNC
jgi:hypothetical protein